MCVYIYIYMYILSVPAVAGRVPALPPPCDALRLGLYQILVCLFGNRALVNTILGIQHLLYCNPPPRILQSILRSIRFFPALPVLPLNIQYW